MKSREELIYALNAGYSFFYVQTYEMQKAVEEIVEVVQGYKYEDEMLYSTKVWDFESEQDPASLLAMLDNESPYTVVIAKNFNWFMSDEYGNPDKEIVSFLQNRVERFTTEDYRKVLIVIGDGPFDKAVPKALDKDFMPLEFGLPDADEIKKLYDYIVEPAKENPKFKAPKKEERTKVLNSCRGMTSREIKNALSFSIVKDDGNLDYRTVSKLRAKDIEKTAGLKELDLTGKSFADCKGYGSPKEFFLNTIGSDLALGMMLLGPPGCGKTLFAKSAGGESGLDVYEAEMAELFGGLVGESESLMRQFIEVISKLAPAILFVDEIEKALAGVGNSQSGDGGTTKRSMAQFLKLLSDNRPKGLYIIATCNNIKQLPPEWVRAERWDCAPFFIDLPNEEEQAEILAFYKEKFYVKGKPSNMKGWSGAEIKTSCRIAAMMGKKIQEVEKFVVPVSETMKDEIDSLRTWAKGKTIPATISIPKVTTSGGKRKIKI